MSSGERVEPGERLSNDLSMLQAALAARLDACWDRLDDVVSELAALHEIGGGVILERVRAQIAEELRLGTRAAADKD